MDDGESKFPSNMQRWFLAHLSTQQCFLDVWSHVKDALATGSNAQSATPQLSQLVDNWTKPEFRQWVQELEKLLNDMVVEKEECSKKDASSVFEGVLLLERAFWPNV